MSAAVRFAKFRCWLFGFNLNNAVGINFWDCFHDPRSPSRSRVMVILMICLQFHVLSPLLFQKIIIHMTLCTVASRHACNVVVTEAILCAASLSRATQPHVMTLVGVSGPAVAWEIASARIPPFISKPNKQKSSGSSLCWFAAFIQQHNGSKDMHKQVLTCWWQSHYPNWFPLLYMYSWCQSSAVDAN